MVKNNNIKNQKSLKATEHSGISIKSLFIGLIWALLIILVLTFILAFISTRSNAMDNSMGVLENVIIIVALLLGGFICARRSQTKGLYHGLILGFLVAVIIMIISLTGDTFMVMPFLIKTAAAIIAGGIGGIIGVK